MSLGRAGRILFWTVVLALIFSFASRGGLSLASAATGQPTTTTTSTTTATVASTIATPVPAAAAKGANPSFFDYFSPSHFKDITSSENAYAKSCRSSRRSDDVVTKTWTQTCQVLAKSDLCKNVKESDRIDCARPEQNKIDLASFDFVYNCAWGLWESFKGFVEFVMDLVKAVARGAVGAAEYLASPGFRAKLNGVAGEKIEAIQNYFLLEFEKTKDRNPGMSDAQAMQAVAQNLIKLAINKVYQALDDQANSLGCYAPARRTALICKVVGDLTMPPAAFVGALVNGAKALKASGAVMTLGRGALAKAGKIVEGLGDDVRYLERSGAFARPSQPKPISRFVEARPKASEAEFAPQVAPVRTANRTPLQSAGPKGADAIPTELQKSAFREPVDPNRVTSYNLSDVLRSRGQLATDRGAAKYREAARQVVRSEDREAIVGTTFTQRLGAGFNGEVMLGKDGHVYKFPLSAKGAVSLETEAAIAKELARTEGSYGIKVLENLRVDPQFRFIQKAQVPREDLATEILAKGPLSADQTQALEDIYLRARVFARQTGIGLDLKAENLYWDRAAGRWALLEAGPRTSYLPYGYTLDVPNFKEYEKIWNSADPPSSIEKAAGRELFGQYQDIANDLFVVEKAREGASAHQIARSTANIVSSAVVAAPTKFHAADELPRELKALALSEKVKLQNAVDVETPLKAGIEISTLKGDALGDALYQATRMSTLRDYFGFLSELDNYGGRGRSILALSGQGGFEESLKYLASKNGSKMSFIGRDALLGEIKSSREKRLILMTTGQARMVASDRSFMAALSKSPVEIAVTDQIHEGITAFNFRNPKAIAQALDYKPFDRMLDFKRDMEKLGFGSKIKPVFYDPDAPLRLRLAPLEAGRLSEAEAAKRIGPPEFDARATVDRVEENIREAAIANQKLNVALTEMHLESLAKTNERIGKMLEDAKLHAARKGLDPEPYFFVGSESKSPILIKKILRESYGIPENRFLHANANREFFGLVTGAQKPMLLVIDDFVGSGESIMNFSHYAGKQTFFQGAQGERLTPSIHPFAPFATRRGIERMKMEPARPFFHMVVNDTRSSFSRQAAKERSKLQMPSGFDNADSLIGFEYMAPDNNIFGLGEVLESWTPRTAIKNY